MSKTISLNNIDNIKFELDFEDVINENAEELVELLKTKSPDSHRPGRKTHYKNGWVVAPKPAKSRYEYGVVVWNETDWQLTWLLENGHLIINNRKTGEIYWVEPRKHIKKSFDIVEPKFKRDIKRKTKLRIK